MGFEHRDIHNVYGMYLVDPVFLWSFLFQVVYLSKHKATYDGLVERNADRNERLYLDSWACMTKVKSFCAFSCILCWITALRCCLDRRQCCRVESSGHCHPNAFVPLNFRNNLCRRHETPRERNFCLLTLIQLMWEAFLEILIRNY